MQMPQIPKEKRQKFDKRSRLLKFVGYANNGYRLLNESTHTVTISRDVVFDEDTTSTIDCSILNNSTTNETSDDDFAAASHDSHSMEEVSDSAISETEEGTHDDSFVTASDDESSVTGNNPAQEEEYELRRSDRIRQPPKRFQDYETTFLRNIEEIPQMVEQLKDRNNWSLWKEAIKQEINSLIENKTWIAVNSSESRKAVKSKWVFTIKDDNRYKARLVAKGCSHKPGLGYQETFAPVAKMNSNRVMLSLANEHKLIIHQMDVKQHIGMAN